MITSSLSNKLVRLSVHSQDRGKKGNGRVHTEEPDLFFFLFAGRFCFVVGIIHSNGSVVGEFSFQLHYYHFCSHKFDCNVDMNYKYVLTLTSSTMIITLMLIRIQSSHYGVKRKLINTEEFKENEESVISNLESKSKSFEETVKLYLQGRDKGMNLEQIANNIFNVSNQNITVFNINILRIF